MMDRLITGLAGPHVHGSLLPEVLDTLCRDAGLNISFELIDTVLEPSFELAGAVEDQAGRGWTGISVAGSLEFAAAQLVAHSLDPDAKRIGAVNLLVFEDPIKGLNTNYAGFLNCWRSVAGDSRPGAVALAGANGIGRAIATALCDLGAIDIAIWDEVPDRAIQAADAIGGAAHAVPACDWQEITRNASGLVNATPVGTHHKPGMIFHESAIFNQQWALDVVHKPANTRFMNIARESGLYCISGFEFFVHTALDSFAALTRIAPDHERALKTFTASQLPAA